MTPWLSILDEALAPAGIKGSGHRMDASKPEVAGNETAGAIARPPLLFLATLLLGFLADRLLPLPILIPKLDPVHWIIGSALVLIGLAIVVAGIRNFSSAETPVQGTKPTLRLVTTGIHGLSRNPIYVGMFLVYGGVGLALLSPWIFAFALPLALVIRYGVVAREEAYLEKRFGDSYRNYVACVRRWI
jgi:protein-S-isoprenylcysteine O-methyltransferase Ste14